MKISCGGVTDRYSYFVLCEEGFEFFASKYLEDTANYLFNKMKPEENSAGFRYSIVVPLYMIIDRKL